MYVRALKVLSAHTGDVRVILLHLGMSFTKNSARGFTRGVFRGGGGGGGGGGRGAVRPGRHYVGGGKKGGGEKKRGREERKKKREREGERERERAKSENQAFFWASQKYKNGSQTYDNLAMYTQKVENDLCRHLLSVSILLYVVLRPELPTTTIHLDCVYSLMSIL